jgi:phage terminase large subunit-like protein
MSTVSDKMFFAALEKLEKLRKQECFDPANPDSKPTAAQQQVINDFGHIKIQVIRSGTQAGKSQTCSRLVTWVLTETHPTWKRPAEWGEEPLLAIVAGRTGKQIEESLLPKIRSYLEPSTYKEVRIGNIIQRLELTNGNRIVFQSLENPNMARERIQSYVAHIAWIDELPPTVDVMDELLRRIQARDGYFLASFTPLVRNLKVQKFVDALVAPLAKTYRFKMLDNPLYADTKRREDIMASLAHLPEHVRNSRLFGDWMSDDNAVYQLNPDNVIAMPSNYSPMWRHVESVDPASSSALGYTLWAEDPSTGIWYCVKAEYVKGIFVPTEIINTVQKLSYGYNVVKRVSDTEPWFIHQAAQMGIKYTAVYEKANRKLQMIKKVQELLGSTLKIAPHCEALFEELSGMRWSETKEDKIVSSNDYHLHDTAAYFVDNMPKRETPVPLGLTWQGHLWQQHTARKAAEEAGKIKVMRQAIQRRGRQHARRTR